MIGRPTAIHFKVVSHSLPKVCQLSVSHLITAQLFVKYSLYALRFVVGCVFFFRICISPEGLAKEKPQMRLPGGRNLR